MQSKEEKILDARTFAQICESLPAQKRKELSSNICADLIMCERAVRNWMNGRTKPATWPQRERLVRTIKRIVGIQTSPETLFQ